MRAACAPRDFSYNSQAETGIWGWLLIVEKGALRWQICLTLEASGDDWQARKYDDSVAAILFAGLQLY
jgi:hypothetical protein